MSTFSAFYVCHENTACGRRILVRNAPAIGSIPLIYILKRNAIFYQFITNLLNEIGLSTSLSRGKQWYAENHNIGIV